MERQSREPWKPVMGEYTSRDRRRAGGIYPAGQLRDLIEYELARADRSNADLSLVICDVRALQRERSGVSTVIREMARSIRRTDHLGWYEEGRVGVLLPMTDREGTRRFLANLELNGYRDRIEIAVYSYPQNWVGASDEPQSASAQEEVAFRQEVLRLEQLADLMAMQREHSHAEHRR